MLESDTVSLFSLRTPRGPWGRSSPKQQQHQRNVSSPAVFRSTSLSAVFFLIQRRLLRILRILEARGVVTATYYYSLYDAAIVCGR
jgi:hypothetical protein